MSAGHSVKTRLDWLDALRGCAIILMVIFHFFYDLSYFGWYDSDVSGVSNWLPLRYLIIGLFAFAMGVSLHVVHAKRFKPSAYARWLLKVFLAGLGVIVATYFVFPHNWVYFGILQFMLVASFGVMALLRWPLASVVVGVAMVVAFRFGNIPYGWPITEIQFLFHNNISVDYVPLFPWLGVALIGAGVAQRLKHSVWLQQVGVQAPHWIKRLGRHTLVIYLAHQPVMLGMMFVVKWLFL